MGYESSVRAGSGVSILREGLVPGFNQAVPGLRGSNVVVINYEDINSAIGIVQSSGLDVGGDSVQITSPANRLRGRRELTIQNLGPAPAYVGASGVTVDTGLQLPSGNLFTLRVLDLGDIYAVSDSTSNLRILEVK